MNTTTTTAAAHHTCDHNLGNTNQCTRCGAVYMEVGHFELLPSDDVCGDDPMSGGWQIFRMPAN